jgi:hypothetical protein
MRVVMAAAVLAAIGTATAAPAAADVDTDFASHLHGHGIYGQRDYNAWLGKLTCKRLTTHLDANAFESASFVSQNMPTTTTTDQAWLFLGAAISTYCPEQTPALESAAAPTIR